MSRAPITSKSVASIIASLTRALYSPRLQTLLGSCGAIIALGLAIAAVDLGAGSTSIPIEGMPPQVRALWVPGKINVVHVVDFECPQCRRMQAHMEGFLKEFGDRVHFTRIIAPSPDRTHSRDAGRAYLCAQKLGKGEEMAAELFNARRLWPEDCERMASFHGIDTHTLRACVRRSDIDERLDQAFTWSRAASPKGLPVTWIQDCVLSGFQTTTELRQAALAGSESNSEHSPGGNPKAHLLH